MTEPWRDLLDAARRRLEMLEDDRRDLLEELDKGATSPDVPLRVQRPFDNLLLRFVAATDQTTDALILAGGLDPAAGKRKQAIRQTAARLSGELARDIAEWFNAPVRADAETSVTSARTTPMRSGSWATGGTCRSHAAAIPSSRATWPPTPTPSSPTPVGWES